MKEQAYESYFDKKKFSIKNMTKIVIVWLGKIKKLKNQKSTKRFNDKLTGKEVVTVKTIISYIDGEEVVDNYVL